MGLLDRVAMLVRANLNDLIDRAEDPEKMLKQVILDMQNQLMQVKTQVALAMADEHLLRQKVAENRSAGADWLAKADAAVEQGKEELARSAIERAISHNEMAGSYAQQLQDQQTQVEHLKSALHRLEAKLAEARTKSDLLRAQRRSAQALSRATQAKAAVNGDANSQAFHRMKDKVQREAALSAAFAELERDDIDEELTALSREKEVERILREIKGRKGGSV